MLFEELIKYNCLKKCCKAEENKSKFSFATKGDEYFLLFKIDSKNGLKFLENSLKIRNPKNKKKNDYLAIYLNVTYGKKVIVLIELKGKKKNIAVEQVKNTAENIAKIYPELFEVFEFKAVIVHTDSPLNTNKSAKKANVKNLSFFINVNNKNIEIPIQFCRFVARGEELRDFFKK